MGGPAMVCRNVVVVTTHFVVVYVVDDYAGREDLNLKYFAPPPGTRGAQEKNRLTSTAALLERESKMRLTQVVLGVFKKKGITGQPFRFTRRIPGRLDIGKIRIVPDLKKGHKLRMFERLAIEEENIAYISKPYLTEAEAKHLPTEYVEANRSVRKVKTIKHAPLRSVYLAEILNNLNVTRAWEV
ncbi:hypothetical protein BIW11_09713 [Tropilaelaps mercedesae]|uniref:Uncharacterized protein n=1 Tax=Tropilaelaps mercedesae TaxID=418985 RepID=A0A1V9XIV1_9ACAR|nr:hypothetical protein BIW11_09713 [Tropilaelaps mercedesae]